MDHPRDPYLDPLPVSARLREAGIGLAMAGIISAALFGGLYLSADRASATAVAGTPESVCTSLAQRAGEIMGGAAIRWIEAGIITVDAAQALTPDQLTLLLNADEASAIVDLSAVYNRFNCE